MVSPDFPRPYIENPLQVPASELAARGIRMFVSTSVKYPQSNMAAAAEIALACQQTGEDPRAMHDAIVGQPELVERLTSMANNVHANREAETPEITPQKVRYVLKSCFHWADPLRVLSPEELHQLIDAYMENGERSSDATLRTRANKMIGDRGKGLGIIAPDKEDLAGLTIPIDS